MEVRKSWESGKKKRVRRGNEHHSRTHPEVVVKGENCWNVKLTRDIVELIRKRVLRGEAKKALAREYKVDPSLIRQICRNKIWKSIL